MTFSTLNSSCNIIAGFPFSTGVESVQLHFYSVVCSHQILESFPRSAASDHLAGGEWGLFFVTRRKYHEEQVPNELEA